MSKQRVAVAMSGGVDSSVAAAMLIEQGYDVVGVTMRMWIPSGLDDSTQAEQDAGEVASNLGIPHHVLDVSDAFERCVIQDFIDEYRQGHTPNPCARCNPEIKFGLFRKHAQESLGAELIATGHYARIERDDITGRWKLLRGVDRTKDQSYVLYRLNQSILAGTLLPLGYHSKEQVRAKARELGLSVVERPESQDICFVPDGKYQDFLKSRAPELVRRGPIVDTSGRVLGQHDGIAFHTVGQRRGLRIAAGIRLYVVAIDAATNTLVVGGLDDLRRKSVSVKNVNWISGDSPIDVVVVSARIRYNTQDSPAVLTVLPDGMVGLEFEAEQRAVTPGQSAVFYRGDEVLGGGVIAD